MISIVRILSEGQGKDFWDYVVAHRKGEKIWNYIVEHKKEFQASLEGKGRLLYLTRLAKKVRRGDLSLFIHTFEPNALCEFITEDLGKIEGITSIWSFFLLKPVFYPLPKDTRALKRFVVTIGITPKNAAEVYNTLNESDLPEGLLKSYLAYTFNLFGESIQFSVLSAEEEKVDRYLSEHISRMPGVKKTTIYPIEATKPLVSYEEWVEYSQRHSIVVGWDHAHMVKQFADWSKKGLVPPGNRAK